MNQMINTTQTINNIPDPAIIDGGVKSQSQLGKVLQETRQYQGLELSDIASTTHVRKEYLKALDEGRYDDLPENVYTRNFLRLYAQAIGLEEKPILELYNQERYGVSASRSIKKSRPNLKLKEKREKRNRGLSVLSNNTHLWVILLSLATLAVLLVGIWRVLTLPDSKVGWLFNLPWTQTSVATPEATPLIENSSEQVEESDVITEAFALPYNEDSDNESNESALPTNDLVIFSLTTVPEGARVSLDNYDLGFTPINEAPLTPAEQKVLQISLEGYETIEETIDVSKNIALSYALVETGANIEASGLETSTTEVNQSSVVTDDVVDSTNLEDTATEAILSDQNSAANDNSATENASNETATSNLGSSDTRKITIDIGKLSWLEIYNGTERSDDSRLVYRMAQSGESFTFDLPVYVRSGNSNTVHITIDGQDQGFLSDTGAVVGKAFE